MTVDRLSPRAVIRVLAPVLLVAAFLDGSIAAAAALGDEFSRNASSHPSDRLEVAVQGAAPAIGDVQAPAEPPPEGAAAVGESVDEPLPTILRSVDEIPAPVREMREKLLSVARSGDFEKLRALMSAQPEPPAVSLGDPGDPADYLKALSADADGREILAILLEVLESGFAHVGTGTEEEQYVWPYFAQYPLNALTPEQLVELFTLLTAADYEDMKSYGAYTFFRVAIAPDGRWLSFLAGD
jgi:hypothetical protein